VTPQWKDIDTWDQCGKLGVVNVLSKVSNWFLWDVHQTSRWILIPYLAIDSLAINNTLVMKWLRIVMNYELFFFSG